MEDDIAPVPAIAALSAFALTIVAGVGMGFLVSAAVVDEGFTAKYAIMTERPMESVTSTFNWLIFALFAAAAFVAAAAAWAGSSVARAHWVDRQHRRPAPAVNSQPKAPSAFTVGPSLGVKPAGNIDPPHL